MGVYKFHEICYEHLVFIHPCTLLEDMNIYVVYSISIIIVHRYRNLQVILRVSTHARTHTCR